MEGLQQPVQKQSQERSFLMPELLGADCIHVAPDVFLCPLRLPVGGMTTRENFFHSSENLRAGEGLIYRCLRLAVIKVAIIVS